MEDKHGVRVAVATRTSPAPRLAGRDSSLPERRVLIADSCALVREGWMRVIEREPDLVCCGATTCPASAREEITQSPPDLLLMDLHFGAADGLTLLRALCADFPAVRVLVVSDLCEELYAGRALKAGAVGYVRKSERLGELLSAIRACLEGDVYLSRKQANALLRVSTGPRTPRQRSGLDLLSDRELEVLRMVGSGLATKEIAAAMQLSIKTVETYRNSIKRKLGLADGTALLRYAILRAQGLAGAAN